MKFLSSSHKCKNISKIFVHNTVYQSKLIVIIFANLPFQVNFNIFGSTNVYTPNYMKHKLFIPQHRMRYQLVKAKVVTYSLNDELSPNNILPLLFFYYRH
jgi:hypothetical protein